MLPAENQTGTEEDLKLQIERCSDNFFLTETKNKLKLNQLAFKSTINFSI